MRRDDDDILPVYNRPSSSRKPLSDCYVHLVPLIVFFAIFVLWRFSNSEVNVEFKDGVITVDYDTDIMLESLNETRFDMAFLAAAKPPYASNVLIQAVANYTAAAPVKRID